MQINQLIPLIKAGFFCGLIEKKLKTIIMMDILKIKLWKII